MSEYSSCDEPSIFKMLMAAVVVIVVLTGFAWMVQGSDFILYKYWAPKYEQVQRETFEQTRSFNQGMIQELESMQIQYLHEKDPKAREALAAVILHRVSGYNMEDPDVPQTLKTFIYQLKMEQQNK